MDLTGLETHCVLKVPPSFTRFFHCTRVYIYVSFIFCCIVLKLIVIISTFFWSYHAARNIFERFHVFLESISRFELDFVTTFFEQFEFLVCSKCNHTQCGRTCACAVACLYPHNSTSNVVASVLWKVKGSFNRTSWKVSDVQIVRETWVVSSFSLCLFVCICVSLSLFVVCCVLLWCSWLWLWWVEGGEEEGGGRKK